MSLSILTKEFLHSKILSDFSYFITTSKAGIISIIKNNKILFSIDLNKKIYKTYFQQEIVMKGNNVTLPMEGKLFRVFPGRTNLEENLEIDNFELDNFEELTTPIRELVDMTPFSFWFNQDYHYDGNKNYSIIKLINKNKMNNFDINLDEIIFVDYNLIYLKNNDQIWNTIVTNVFFTGDNERNQINNNNIKIDENIVIYENIEALERYIKENFGNNYNDISYIHGYDKNKKKYFKIYDFNTYMHLKQNSTLNNNFEEQYMNNL